MGNNHLLPSFRFKFNTLVGTPAVEDWMVYDPDFCLSNLDFSISDYQIDHTNYGTAQKIPTDLAQDGPFTLRVTGLYLQHIYQIRIDKTKVVSA